MPGLKTLGRYEIVAELGHGAMGTVYEAVDSSLDRLVALKTIRLDPTGPDFAEFRERFRAEAKSAGRLSHPNIVVIHDFGEVGDTAYIAMEFLRGETLRAMLDRQRFSIRRAIRYALQISDGLAAAHAAGVVHRDIKPANVLRLRSGLLKITDFGIAQLPASQLTQDGTFMGTPKYMSPEQGLGLRVDGRSDIFSLGVMLYEMLTGTLPFGGSSLSGLMTQVVYEQPIHPKRWNPAIPDALVQIVAKCLAKNPDMRYDNAVELGIDLRQYKYMEPAVDTALIDVFLPIDPEHIQDALASTVPLPATSGIPRGSKASANDDWHGTLPVHSHEDPAPPRAAAPSRLVLATPPRWAIGFALAAFMSMAAGLYVFDRVQSPVSPLLDSAASHGPAALPQKNATASNALVPPPQHQESASSASPPSVPLTAALNPLAVVPQATLPKENSPLGAAHKSRSTNQNRKRKKKIVAQPSPLVPVALFETPLVPVPMSPPLAQRSLQPPPSPEQRKAARLAAFRRDLESQHDCLVSNKCN